jgi:hypothetical protein
MGVGIKRLCLDSKVQNFNQDAITSKPEQGGQEQSVTTEMLLGQQMMLKASQKKMHSNYSSRRM